MLKRIPRSVITACVGGSTFLAALIILLRLAGTYHVFGRRETDFSQEPKRAVIATATLLLPGMVATYFLGELICPRQNLDGSCVYQAVVERHFFSDEPYPSIERAAYLSAVIITSVFVVGVSALLGSRNHDTRIAAGYLAGLVYAFLCFWFYLALIMAHCEFDACA
jgi:hypothetical protein